MNDEETEFVDVETMGIKVEGLTMDQIRKLRRFYVSRTQDPDLDRLDFFTKGLPQ